MLSPQQAAASALEPFTGPCGEIYTPIDPVVVARQLGINVYSTKMAADVSGYVVKQADAAPDIFLNNEHSPVRQRFTCAHELGHYFAILNRGDKAPESYVFRRDRLASCGVDGDEIYANQFAANLLMPDHAVRELAGQGRDVIEIAREFHVSVEAASHRMKNLGL
ncbi:MAG: ImmA/IrrE family metallo-endopeptidase [Mycolicibacterium sp.]|jgi:Zn-dependent peptidase ImmA (M78 family)|nr:ImmA/IrrE family metallo-endopeptidase [Mycolicibacterium sp.]